MKKDRLEDNLRLLHPEENQTALKKEFYRARIRETAVAAGAVLLLLALCAGGVFAQRQLTEDSKIMRNPWEGGEKTVELTAVMGETRQGISLTVQPQSYTQDELEAKFWRVLPSLEKQLLGSNPSPDAVRENLCFARQIEGAPFTFIYESSDLQLLTADGELGGRIPEQGGETVGICITASCGEFERSYYMRCKVLPPVSDGTGQERHRLLESVQAAEAAGRESGDVELPREIDGKTVSWRETKENYGPAVLALGVLCMALLWLNGSQKIEKQVKARNDFLTFQYPELVSTLTLLLGAGLTVRSAFHKILQEQQRHGGSNDLTRELALLCHEMDTGISEGEAYARFGKRCRLQPYRRLAALLAQSLKLGAGGLLEQLEYETHNALEEKRAQARQAGEEAGSKLLLPMTAMLLLVMALIVIPAFGSFGGA